MALRTGHGNGAGSPRVEVLPPDELPPAQADGAARLGAGRDPLTKRLSKSQAGSEAARAMAKLPRRSRFVPKALSCDPRFEPHNRRRLEWQRKRLAELQAAHGGVSHGVGAMLNAAAWLYAAGEFASELAAAAGDLEGFKQAATLTGTARQHELAAWELSAREAQARPKQSGRQRLEARLGTGKGVQ